MLPEKVGQSSPKFFRECYPLRPPIMPNFIEIGQTSLETGGCQLGLGQKKLFCHRQKRDYLSRDSQCARGATKKQPETHTCRKPKINSSTGNTLFTHVFKCHQGNTCQTVKQATLYLIEVPLQAFLIFVSM